MDIEFKRQPGETEEQFIFRVCAAREALGGWCNVAQAINRELGYGYSESKYRKDWAAQQKYSLGQGGVIDKDALDDMTRAATELAMERQKLSAEKLELNRQIRQNSRFELFYEKVADAVQTLPVPEFNPIYSQNSGKDYVLAVSDIHYGATFESENNRYSRDISRQRLENLCGQVIVFVRENNLNHVNILSLGDSLQGLLRVSDLGINDIPVVDCVVEISRLLAQFLNEISSYCNIDFYAVSAANHSQTRPLGSKASELATEDLERIIVSYVSDMLMLNDRVCVHTDLSRDYVSFNLFGYDCLALHGHQIKNTGSALRDYSLLHQKLYSYMFLGHMHAAQEIVVGEKDNHNCEVLVCPSIIGSDPYSDKLTRGSKGAARIYEFDEVYGHTGTKTFILN